MGLVIVWYLDLHRMVDFQGRYDIPYTDPMGLVYLPIHLPYKSTIHVGKYTIRGSFGIYVVKIDFLIST